MQTRSAARLISNATTASTSVNRLHLVRELKDLAGRGLGILLLSHDLGLVRELADHTIVLDAGRVVGNAVPAMADLPTPGTTGKRRPLLKAMNLSTAVRRRTLLHAVDLSVVLRRRTRERHRRVVEQGPPATLTTGPTHPEIRQLVEAARIGIPAAPLVPTIDSRSEPRR